MDPDDSEILAEQVRYYRARAPEYEDWFLRLGRYDHGEELKRQWFEEIATVEAALAEANRSGSVLEYACGTGLWTVRQARSAASLTCVDASPEVIALNKARVLNPTVEYVEADIFRWEPRATYDFIFFGFWLSHVPESHFDIFWRKVRSALRPTGQVFFVDSREAPEAAAMGHASAMGDIVERQLNDGRAFHLVKIYHEPAQLAQRLGDLGWAAAVRQTPRYFIYGSAQIEPTL